MTATNTQGGLESPGNKLSREIGLIVLQCLYQNLQACFQRVGGTVVGKRHKKSVSLKSCFKEISIGNLFASTALPISFLAATGQFYKMVCRSVGLSVCRLVGRSVCWFVGLI